MELNQGQSGRLEGDQIIQIRTSDQRLDLKLRQDRRVLARAKAGVKIQAAETQKTERILQHKFTLGFLQ